MAKAAMPACVILSRPSRVEPSRLVPPKQLQQQKVSDLLGNSAPRSSINASNKADLPGATPF